MKEFSYYADLTGKNRQLELNYHGNQPSFRNVESRIVSEQDDSLTVGVGLWKEDIAANRYDPKRASLDLWYLAPPIDTIRMNLRGLTPRGIFLFIASRCPAIAGLPSSLGLRP